MSAAVLIAGSGAVPFSRRRDGSSWRDWVRAAAGEALADADLEPRDVDALVLASESDVFSLQLSPGAVAADDLGLDGAGITRVENGGASGAAALRTAFALVASGLARRVLTVGFETTASSLDGDSVRALYGLSFDADLEGFAGVSAVALYALSIRLHMDRHGTTAEQLARVSVKNHGNALGNPNAHKPMRLGIDEVLASPAVSTPYRRLDCSPLSDGAAAVVIAARDALPGGAGARVRIAGSGAASDRVRLGDRADPSRFEAKARAARAACTMAGVRDPAAEIGVAEVYDAFTGAEIQSIEALGLAREGHAAGALADGEFDAGGRLPVNLSGGLIGQGAAPGATGVMQAVTAHRLLGGRYWPDLQPDPAPRVALIDAHGGVCTGAVVHVLEREE